MAEQEKKLPDIKELLQVKQQIRDSGSKADLDRVNDLILKRKKMDEGLVKSTDVTGAGGKEAFKMAPQSDQTFKVKVGKPEVISTKEPIKTITGVTQKIDNTPIKVGTKDIYGRGVKAAAEGTEGIASTVAKKAGKFLGKGRLAGVGAFMTGLAAALKGEDVSASETAMGAAEALAPAGVSEALQSESLGPSIKSADAYQRASAKIEMGDQDKLTPEERQALDEMKAENQRRMQQFRVK